MFFFTGENTLHEKEADQNLARNSSQTSSKNRPFLFAIFLFLPSLFALVITGWGQIRLIKQEYKQRSVRRMLKAIDLENIYDSQYSMNTLPLELKDLPLGEESGVIISVKKIDLKGVDSPYNGSIVPNEDGYDLFFRYDIINPSLAFAKFSSQIGFVSLDREFFQIGDSIQNINLNSEYAEDPRALLVGEDLYLFFNQLDLSMPLRRFMTVAQIDRNTHQVETSTALNLNYQWIEKNWSPFEYLDQNGKSQLMAEYRINPRKLVAISPLSEPKIQETLTPSKSAYLSLHWGDIWGEIKGGTPAQKIGDEYLGFFHSWFETKNKQVWYVMGAYTFQASYPFELTGISKHPILFNEIYDTPVRNTSSFSKRVIFPGSFVVSKEHNGDRIHLACGENDCAIKIVTLDKEALYKTMYRFNTKK